MGFFEEGRRSQKRAKQGVIQEDKTTSSSSSIFKIMMTIMVESLTHWRGSIESFPELSKEVLIPSFYRERS